MMKRSLSLSLSLRTGQQGFPLIELMSVVAVIGILASVALPTYQDYTKRARVSEGILAGSACRTTITEVIQSAASNATIGDNGWGCEKAAAPASTKFVKSVTTAASSAGIAGGGRVAVTMRNLGSPIDDTTIILSPCSGSDQTNFATCTQPALGTNVVAWLCGSGTIPIKYLPGSCRAPATGGT